MTPAFESRHSSFSVRRSAAFFACARRRISSRRRCALRECHKPIELVPASSEWAMMTHLESFVPSGTNRTTERPRCSCRYLCPSFSFSYSLMSKLHLTQRELDIMSALWEMGEATVTEVRDKVDPDLAYTSISSMIRTLELKGYVSHRRGEGKTHVYFPAIDPETAGESALGRVLDKIYGGSPLKLLTHLVEQRRLSDKDLERMRELLKKPAKKKR